jgi:hypothetical protein
MRVVVVAEDANGRAMWVLDNATVEESFRIDYTGPNAGVRQMEILASGVGQRFSEHDLDGQAMPPLDPRFLTGSTTPTIIDAKEA